MKLFFHAKSCISEFYHYLAQNATEGFEKAETGRWWKFCSLKQGGTETRQEDGIIGRL